MLDAYHVQMSIARMVPKLDAAIMSNVHLSTCHAIMRCTTWLRGPVSAKYKPAAIMPNPYRIHSPPPPFNVALLSLRSRVFNAPTANIDGLGQGLGLIIVLT